MAIDSSWTYNYGGTTTTADGAITSTAYTGLNDWAARRDYRIHTRLLYFPWAEKSPAIVEDDKEDIDA